MLGALRASGLAPPTIDDPKRWFEIAAVGTGVLGGIYLYHKACLEWQRRSEMDYDEPAQEQDDWRFKLIRSVGEECQSERELRGLLKMKRNCFILYDGFEPSGRMHIAQGVFKAINVNKCTRAGGTFTFWVADWFALMNDKMGGDLEKIKTVGKYLIEVWKAGGMDMSRVKFLWSSDEISKHAEEYWGQALDIARRSTLGRIKKCCQIMGRAEDKLTGAQIMYPLMQATDIFFLKADICQLGVDQRKVNMLARDYCDMAGKKKPVILSHHMLYGLKAGQAKMSKSDPDSAIFMEDTPEDVERKIRNAYCPTRPEASTLAAKDEDMSLVVDDLMNPCLDYLRYILFSRPGFSFKANGKVYTDFEKAKKAFVAGDISEKQLKDQLIAQINLLLDPVRKHFANDAFAKGLLDKIRLWKKDSLVPTSTFTRAQLPSKKLGTKSKVFVVFAPHPEDTVRLDAILGVLQRLQQAPGGSQVVLWLEDWSAFTLGCVGGSNEYIKSYYEVFLFGLRSLAPELMKRVQVFWQGEAIVKEPSEYWISVINAGRRLSMEAIRSTLPYGSNLEYASEVINSLMHIGDVFSLCGEEPLTLCCDRYHENIHRLAADQCKVSGLPVPQVKLVETPRLRLHESRDGKSLRQGLRSVEQIMLTDGEAEVTRKIKKAFCEPGSTDFCPPLVWAQTLLSFRKEFAVTREQMRGGDKSYSEASALQADFARRSLHPNDLKPAVARTLNALLSTTRAELQSSDPLTKAVKDLEKSQKERVDQ